MDVSWTQLNNWWRQDPLYKLLPPSLLAVEISTDDAVSLVDSLRPLYIRYLDTRFPLASTDFSSYISTVDRHKERRLIIIFKIYQRAIRTMFRNAYFHLHSKLKGNSSQMLTIRDCLNMWGQSLQYAYLLLFQKKTYQWGYAKLLEVFIECH